MNQPNTRALRNPAPWQSMPAMLEDCCTRYADQPAIIDGEREITFAELHHRVRQCAAQLQAKGLAADENVVIWAQNSWQWIVLAFACWQAGAVVVPVSSRHKAMEVAPVLQRCRSRWLFASANCLGEDLASTLDTDTLAQIEHLYALNGDSALASANAFDALLAGDSPGINTAHSDSLCQILFTSGTTGQPKGVMLGSEQLLQAYWDWSAEGGLKAGDRFLVIPPFSHGFGINAGIVACVMRGMTHVVVDFFDPAKTLSLVKTHRISVMSGAPALFKALALQVAQNRDDRPGHLRVAYVGAAQVPVDVIRSMQDTLGIARVINAYGLIEGCVVSMTRADDGIDRISTTVGTAMPNVAVRICADNDEPLPTGKTGEIQLQSYGVMRGYFEAEKTTREAINDAGWLRTGDMGSIDAQGYITIQGRKKDMYICNGFNVYPAEVEELLRQNSSVADCAVLGISDAQRGESGVAFVIPAAGGDRESGDALRQWCKTHIASYKVPSNFHFIDALPLNANGKVQKEVLREQLRGLDRV